jgi:hypothetical protein
MRVRAGSLADLTRHKCFAYFLLRPQLHTCHYTSSYHKLRPYFCLPLLFHSTFKSKRGLPFTLRTHLLPPEPCKSIHPPNPLQPNTCPREVLLGITGKDFVLLASSKAAMRGATILKSSDDKTRTLNRNNLLAFSGEAGDTIQFAEFIQANISLYSMRNEVDLGPAEVASFVRGELARSLRSRKPYNVNLLLGGVDGISKEPSLYWLDYLASSAKVPYAAHGYAQ